MIPCADAHTVLMACQRAIMKYDALRRREIDLSAPSPPADGRSSSPLNKGRDGVNINILRTIPASPMMMSIGRVSFAGER